MQLNGFTAGISGVQVWNLIQVRYLHVKGLGDSPEGLLRLWIQWDNS